MILLDTNVLSETLRPAPEPRVLQWLDQQAPEALFISSITLAEMRYGLAAMPQGTKQERLLQAFETQVVPLFAARILSFDEPASRAFAAIFAASRKKGLSLGLADGYIAAIAKTHRMAVASRDRTPFEAAGLLTLDPWA